MTYIDSGDTPYPVSNHSEYSALINHWINRYRRISASTLELVFAEGYLAAISFARLVFFTIIIAFISILVWCGSLLLLAELLSGAGLDWVFIVVFYTVLHLSVLLFCVKAVQTCAKDMQFASSRRLLDRSNTSSDPATQTSARDHSQRA